MSNEQQSMLTTLARLLLYPDAAFDDRLAAALAVLERSGPPAARAALQRFAREIRGRALTERQELFTQTFDFDPAAALEIGWHLFGEDYHRGELLVRLRAELRRHGLSENGELPDHLTLVLPLLDRMAAEEAADFYASCVVPALQCLQEGLRRKNSPYQWLLECLAEVLKERFGHGVQEEPKHVRPLHVL